MRDFNKKHQLENSDQFLVGVHDPTAECYLMGCSIHCPSDHHMRGWMQTWRADRGMERICPHGVGHPDPDALAWYRRTYPNGQYADGVHGCDGCCEPHLPLS